MRTILATYIYSLNTYISTDVKCWNGGMYTFVPYMKDELCSDSKDGIIQDEEQAWKVSDQSKVIVSDCIGWTMFYKENIPLNKAAD